jgi:coenzyme F420-reducing hydrogenase delta subunit
MNNDDAKIYVFYCANSLSPMDVAQIERKFDGRIKSISLPCSGKADLQYLVKAFETGADGLAILTCPLGDCRHLEGNMRANKRCEAVGELLEEIGMGTGRTCVIECVQDQPDAALSKLKKFCSGIKHLSRTGASTTA